MSIGRTRDTSFTSGNQVIGNRFDPINIFVKKGEDAHDPKAQLAGVYPGFLSMKPA